LSQLFRLSMHTAPTATYSLSLHDALPIFPAPGLRAWISVGSLRVHRSRLSGLGARLLDIAINLAAPGIRCAGYKNQASGQNPRIDRKSTRLNSSHVKISYAVFCLKKKKIK